MKHQRSMLKNYKELKVCQRFYQLCLKIYRITKGFFKEERYGLPVRSTQTGLTSQNTSDWQLIWVAVLAPLIIITLFIQFTHPVVDGDPWWQMAYGRYFIENRTLTLDHSIFTWSEADNTPIYCTWLAQIFLYLLYKAGGLPALFILRYLCMSSFVLLVWLFARKAGIHRHPITWLFCLLGVLMSNNAGLIKPELFSYVFINLVVANWIYVKSSEERAWKFCYFFPLIMLVWVNSHGGFIFGALFLFMMGVGEEINALYCPAVALSHRIRRHLFFALFLSAIAIFITPYGWHYPAYLLRRIFEFNPQHVATLYAYRSIFAKSARLSPFVDYLIINSAVLVVFIVIRARKREFDWAIIFTNILMIFLYVKYLRTVYFWAPVFAFTALYYLFSYRSGFLWPESGRMKKALGCLIMVACLFLGSRAIYNSITGSYVYRYFGYGISYFNPVDETKFIKKYLYDYRIGNDYNTGGYLLWKLGPEKKIFIDPRDFPFKRWYGEHNRFLRGVNVQEFLDKNPADVWCIQHLFLKLNEWFRKSPQWKPVFYGPSSVLYARSYVDIPEDAPLFSKEIDDIKNFHQAKHVLVFAAAIDDWDNVGLIASGMKDRFRSKEMIEYIGAWQNLHEGMIAYYQKNYRRAAEILQAARDKKLVWNDQALTFAYLNLAAEHWEKYDDELTREAREAVESALKVQPNNAIVLYDIGVIEWYMSRLEEFQPEGTCEYSLYLKKFLENSKNIKNIPQVCRQIASAILNGSYDQRPLILKPAVPLLKKSKIELRRKNVGALGTPFRVGALGTPFRVGALGTPFSSPVSPQAR